MSHWTAWHGAYADPDSSLSRRLRVVQAEIDAWLDVTSPREVRILSVCAGDGRDLLGVLADRHDAWRVTATLVELDAGLAAAAQGRAADLSLERVTVREADAGDGAAYAGLDPADLVLLCGVLGNIDDHDAQRTVGVVRTWCASGARVIWTRSRREPDLVPSIRTWFRDNGFRDLGFHPIPDSLAVVGVCELVAQPVSDPGTSSVQGHRIFTFGRSSTNARTVAAYEARADAYGDAGSDTRSSWVEEFRDLVVARLPRGATVLEIGSATGAGARALEQRGLRVQPSDVTEAFLTMMRRDGLDPLRIDVLHDEIGGRWDAVVAMAVFLHFTREELGGVLDCVRRGLSEDGVLAFTVKEGDGGGWSEHKLGLTRWFTYWREDPLRELVAGRGWRMESLERRQGARDDWLAVLASPDPEGRTPQRGSG